MKKFKSAKGFGIKAIIAVFMSLPLLLFLVEPQTIAAKPLTLTPLLIPISLVWWIYLDTYYIIGDGKVRYKSAFISGSIDITSIEEIRMGKTLYTGLKPSLAANGIVIRYDSGKSIYISPESNDDFIAELRKYNSSIRIVY